MNFFNSRSNGLVAVALIRLLTNWEPELPSVSAVDGPEMECAEQEPVGGQIANGALIASLRALLAKM